MLTLTLTAPIPARLRQIREDLDMPQEHAAEKLHISPQVLSRWEIGVVDSPPVRPLATYAHLVGWQLVARHRNGTVLNLPGALPCLSLLRQRTGRAQDVQGARIHTSPHTVSATERAMRRGTIRLVPLERYLDDFGYEVGLEAAVAA